MDSSVSGGLIEGFEGSVIEPAHSEFEASRQVWNAMHDRHPALVARCQSPADVAAAVRHGRRNGLPIAVRAGGHAVPGYGVCDDGIVIDLRGLNTITIDESTRTATVGGGALLGELDRATNAHGFVVPAGVVSHTGVAGLTLGGGVGRMMRRYGLTVDSLRGAEVVTADSEIVRADERHNPDLFWGIRGGGGNFGVVTSFEFALHPARDLLVLAMFHPLAEAEHVLGLADQIVPVGPDELMWSTFVRPALGQPWIPEELTGAIGLVSFIEWSGEPDAGMAVLEGIKGQLSPAASAIRPMPFLQAQTLVDEVYAHGKRSFFKAGFFGSLGPDLTEIVTEQAAKIRSPFTQIEILSMGGAIRHVDPAATAFPNREPNWLINTPATWTDPADDDREIAWSRESYARLAPLMSQGSYVNFMDADETEDDREGAGDRIFGATLERLRAVKGAYDPENIFRLNQNIVP